MSTVIYTVYVVEYVMHLGLDGQPWDTPVQVRKPTPHRNITRFITRVITRVWGSNEILG